MTDQRKLELVARTGYAARGVVYLLVGGFAIAAALGGGGGSEGSRSALRQLLDEPLGHTMLAAITVGLLAYALWRFVQASFDVDDHGTGAKGLVVRGALLVSAIVNAALAVYAVQLATGWGSAGGSGGSSGWVAEVLGIPGGRWIVAAVGLAIVGAGIAQGWRGWSEQYQRRLVMDARTRRWADPICKTGLLARGVVFVVIGGLFVAAAVNYSPQQAGGLTEALRTIRDSPFGGVTYTLIAFGLFAFGIYSCVEAFYRRVEVPETTLEWMHSRSMLSPGPGR